jgi:hypothetical protein
LALESFLYLNSLADNNKFNQVNTLKLEMMLRDKEARRQAEEAAEEAELKMMRRRTMTAMGLGRMGSRPGLARQATTKQLPVKLIPARPRLARIASSSSNIPDRHRAFPDSEDDA